MSGLSSGAPGLGQTRLGRRVPGCRFPQRGFSICFSPQRLPASQPLQLTHGPTALRHATRIPAARLAFPKKAAKNNPHPRALPGPTARRLSTD